MDTNILVRMKKRTVAWKRRGIGLMIMDRVAFNQRYNWFASASMNGTVIIYDYQANLIRQTLPHNGGVIRMVWHTNNVVLITGCLDGCVYVWDGRTGELLQQLNGHTVG